jgi:hypothetical protein
MIVEFSGGSADKQTIILQLSELMDTIRYGSNQDLYGLRWFAYKQLQWFYVWYQYIGENR